MVKSCEGDITGLMEAGFIYSFRKTPLETPMKIDDLQEKAKELFLKESSEWKKKKMKKYQNIPLSNELPQLSSKPELTRQPFKPKQTILGSSDYSEIEEIDDPHDFVVEPRPSLLRSSPLLLPKGSSGNYGETPKAQEPPRNQNALSFKKENFLL